MRSNCWPFPGFGLRCRTNTNSVCQLPIESGEKGRTHPEAERRGVRHPAGEHVDVPPPADARILDAHDLLARRVRRDRAHLEPLAVAVAEHRAEVALVLDAPGEHGRARACAGHGRGLLLALRDHDLVLDRLLHHVHLVHVPRELARRGVVWVRGEREEDARGFARRGLRAVVYPDRREVHVVLPHGQPALHEVFRDLCR